MDEPEFRTGPMLDLFLGWPSYPDALLKDVVISDPSLKGLGIRLHPAAKG